MPTSVRLDPEYEERLSKLAAETGRTKAYYIKKVMEEAIPRLEYEYGLLKDVEDYRAGKLKTYTLDEVRAECGL